MKSVQANFVNKWTSHFRLEVCAGHMMANICLWARKTISNSEWFGLTSRHLRIFGRWPTPYEKIKISGRITPSIWEAKKYKMKLILLPNNKKWIYSKHSKWTQALIPITRTWKFWHKTSNCKTWKRILIFRMWWMSLQMFRQNYHHQRLLQLALHTLWRLQLIILRNRNYHQVMLSFPGKKSHQRHKTVSKFQRLLQLKEDNQRQLLPRQLILRARVKLNLQQKMGKYLQRLLLNNHQIQRLRNPYQQKARKRKRKKSLQQLINHHLLELKRK